MKQIVGHYSVMAEEMKQYLLGDMSKDMSGSYCDCTAGAGGYAHKILSYAPQSKLVVMDRDNDALEVCRERLKDFNSRVQYFHGSYSRISEATTKNLPLRGVVADLGLSRLQLNDAERGFSFQSNGPLDMRFDRTQDMAAEQIVNHSDETSLADVIYRYGDEHRSRRIAHSIVRARPVRDTHHLAEIVLRSVSKKGRQRIHPATRTFQALRIAVNDELVELEELLSTTPKLLAPDGCFVVVSFHSGEDRLVKRSFRKLATEGVYELLTRKILRPADEEVAQNPPSRSARLRAVRRTQLAYST